MGIGIGIAILFYGFDLIGRIIPDLKEYLFLGPYSYANASAIFQVLILLKKLWQWQLF